MGIQLDKMVGVELVCDPNRTNRVNIIHFETRLE